MNWFFEKNNSLILNIYAIPRSSKTEIVGIYNNSLKIKLKSPPVDNAANEELIRFLAEKLKVPKKNIEIIKGHKQKKKIVCVSDMHSSGSSSNWRFNLSRCISLTSEI